MEWILSKMQLVDVDDSNEQLSEIVAMEEKTWSELMPRKKRRAIEKANGRIYCKNVMDYNDCKLIIEHYKLGTVCIYILDPMQNPESQNMMCYLCGGIYALGGEVCSVGGNVFVAKDAP